MTKHTTQIVDTIILTLFALFCFAFAVLFLRSGQPAPGTSVILLFLSIASFGLAGYRISHKA
jgi:hypothetical protein